MYYKYTYIYIIHRICAVKYTRIVFIHSSVNRHLDYFHVLAIINIIAMDIEGVCIFSNLVLSGYMPRSVIPLLFNLSE